uniref:ATP-dependent Clp protease proteolytic subunit n=1 Tax=Rhizochromulina marina TaxID=1034831 RepID=A0A7S2S0Z5_9STRA
MGTSSCNLGRMRALSVLLAALVAPVALGFHTQLMSHSATRASRFAGAAAPRVQRAGRLGARQGAGGLVMMPIGVPKVAYRIPGSPSADWVDIYNRLYRERIIFLGQEIDDEIANQIIGVMLYLDSEDSKKPIYLYINCPGGSVIAGMALFDTMNHIKSPVVTINLGLSASMASFLLAAGKRGSRMALPHSRVMIHQPMGGAQGQAEDIKVEAAQIMRIKENLVRMYSQMTGQTQEQIIRDLDRDNFMSAQEALEYGLIDKIIETTDK